MRERHHHGMSGTLPESGFASPSERGGKAIFGWWRAERALSYGILSDVVPRDALEAEVEDEHPPVAPITTDGVNVRPRPHMDVPAASATPATPTRCPPVGGTLCSGPSCAHNVGPIEPIWKLRALLHLPGEVWSPP